MNTKLIDAKSMLEKVLKEKFNSEYNEGSFTEVGFSGRFTIDDCDFEVLSGEDSPGDADALLIVMFLEEIDTSDLKKLYEEIALINKKLAKNGKLLEQDNYFQIQLEIRLNEINEKIITDRIEEMIKFSKTADVQALIGDNMLF